MGIRSRTFSVNNINTERGRKKQRLQLSYQVLSDVHLETNPRLLSLSSNEETHEGDHSGYMGGHGDGAAGETTSDVTGIGWVAKAAHDSETLS